MGGKKEGAMLPVLLPQKAHVAAPNCPAKNAMKAKIPGPNNVRNSAIPAISICC